MKVCHRPVLDSGRRQIERQVRVRGSTVSRSFVTVLGCWQKKTTLAVAVIGCNAADSGNKNDRQFYSHVSAQE